MHPCGVHNRSGCARTRSEGLSAPIARSVAGERKAGAFCFSLPIESLSSRRFCVARDGLVGVQVCHDQPPTGLACSHPRATVCWSHSPRSRGVLGSFRLPALSPRMTLRMRWKAVRPVLAVVSSSSECPRSRPGWMRSRTRCFNDFARFSEAESVTTAFYVKTT